MYKRSSILRSALMLLFSLVFLVQMAPPARAWEREPNRVFAERRAKLIAAAGEPIELPHHDHVELAAMEQHDKLEQRSKWLKTSQPEPRLNRTVSLTRQ